MFGASTPTFVPDDLPDLTGRVALVTGGNTGLGRQSILAFLKKGAKVYMAARTESKALASIEEIKTIVPNAKLEFIQMDLQSFASIKSAAESFISKETHLHILLNNAGVMALPYSETKEGYEVQFGTNHMGHFLLTKLLIPIMIETSKTAIEGSVRIVNVSSVGHNMATFGGINFEDMRRERSSTWIRYGLSKLSNILHVVSLSKRLREHGIICTTLHPGFISSSLYDTASNANILTRLGYGVFSLGFTSVEEGALTQIYCAASDKVTLENTGEYYVPIAKKGAGVFGPSKYAKNEELAEKLWVWSEEQLASHGY